MEKGEVLVKEPKAFEEEKFDQSPAVARVVSLILKPYMESGGGKGRCVLGLLLRYICLGTRYDFAILWLMEPFEMFMGHLYIIVYRSLRLLTIAYHLFIIVYG